MVNFVDYSLLGISVVVIIQSNNCFCTQGAGVAKAIRDKYPEVYLADCENPNINKLGTVLPVKLSNNKPSYCFLNYNQYNYGRDKRYVNYEAFYNCLEKSENKCLKLGLSSLALPHGMSSNLAGGSWKIILPMIEDVFNKSSVDCFICKI